MNATIQFTCPHCSHQMKLPSSTVGKQGKCPSCSAVVAITASQPGANASENQVAPKQPVAAPASPQPVHRNQQQSPAAVASPTPQPASERRKSRWKLLCVTHILTAALTIGLMPYWKPHLEPFFPADYLAQNSSEATTPEPDLAAADMAGPLEDPGMMLEPSDDLDSPDEGDFEEPDDEGDSSEQRPSEAERVASADQSNLKLTDFDKRARDFSVTLKTRGERMTLGMGVADFRNKFPDVALKEPTNPDIPKDAGVWFFAEIPTHLEYEEVQGSFVSGRLFQLRKTYGAGNFARLDTSGNRDVGKGLLQLIEDIGHAYGMTATKTTTTSNDESVIHREFPLVHIHMEVQLDRRGKIHVSAQKLDIKTAETKPNTQPEATKKLTLKGHSNLVKCVAFSPDGSRIASGSKDKTIKVWDSETGKQMLTLKGHGEVESVVFSPDGKRIVSGSLDKTLKVWDAETGQEMLTLKGHLSFVRSVAFSPDGKRIASGDRYGRVKVWDAETGQEIRTLKGHRHDAWSVAFSPDGKRIVSGSNDTTVKVWDAETGQEIRTLHGGDHVYSAAFSPDGTRIVSAGWDKLIKVWDAETGQEMLTLKGHLSGVRSVAFSLDGKRIASGSGDETIKVWDAETGQETLTIADAGYVRSMAFSPDRKRIVAGGGDHTVRVWDISPLTAGEEN
jgi:hypothetical protein